MAAEESEDEVDQDDGSKKKSKRPKWNDDIDINASTRQCWHHTHLERRRKVMLPGSGGFRLVLEDGANRKQRHHPGVVEFFV